MKKKHWQYLVSSVFMLGAIQVAVAADFDPLQPPTIDLTDSTTEQQSESESSESESKPKRSVLRAMVESILQQLQREEPPLGSRNQVCAIAPGLLGATDTVWHLRPWFWWSGGAEEVVLLDYETGQEQWSASVASVQSVQYTGDPLTPGNVYIWQLVQANGSVQRHTFAVMEQAQRVQLQQDLETLSAQHHQTVSLAQAQFFGDRALWSDALQSLNQAAATPEIAALKQEIKGYLCNSEQIASRR